MVSVPFPNNGQNKNFKKDLISENTGLVPPQNVQAEDGIRDNGRSRGLGDVYKRQLHTLQKDHILSHVISVSYTHLTLPTMS